MSRKEASAFLAALGCPIAPQTLANLASKGRGPGYIRFGHRIVRYSRETLESWARKQMVVVKGDGL